MDATLIGFNLYCTSPMGATKVHTIRERHFADDAYPTTAMMDAVLMVRKAYERDGWTVESEQRWGY